MFPSKQAIRPWIRRAVGNPVVHYPMRAAAQVGLLPEPIWERLPVEKKFRVPVSGDTGFWYLSTANDQIGRSLYWNGIDSGWERETLRTFRALAANAQLVLDIGANTGVFTLLAAASNPNARVISFEPVPRVYERLTSNINSNNWADRCEARNEAVSNANGVAKLHIPSTDVPSSASLNPEGFRGYKGVVVDVPVTTVDSICRHEDQVDLVKIDVEGFEDKVLEGMRETLIKSTPVIIVECLPDGPYSRVEAILKSHGYRFFHLGPHRPVSVERVLPDEFGKFRNYLAVAHDEDRVVL